MPHKAPLEAAVMTIMWDAPPGGLTPAAVQERLRPTDDVAYTTAMTVLSRLWKKGRLSRFKVGRAYSYFPAEPRSAYEARRMAEILRSVDDRSLTLSRFLDSLTPAERAELLDLMTD